MKNITLEKIPQKSIRTFIQEQVNNNVHSISDLKSTYTKGKDLSNYLLHEKVYKVPHPPEKVWQHYMTANPNKVWNGKMLSFGLMVSKHDGLTMYVDEEYSAAKVGQVFYINLSILGGLIKVAVAHEIIAIEPEKKYFELSYVEGSKSFGKQRIAFFGTDDGNTRIEHTTYYKSDSNFRDRYIYPFFHTRAIGEYHQNMANSIF
jgi:hypothetical protein